MQRDFTVDEHDLQDVKFVESNDGYHCWQAQPTAYHIIYACLNYPELCEGCLHVRHLCIIGLIDFRMPAGAVIGEKTSAIAALGWEEYQSGNHGRRWREQKSLAAGAKRIKLC